MNWRERGRVDGKKGRSFKYFNKHSKTCLKYGVTADTGEYTAGRAEGLKNFYTYKNGLKYGQDGNDYKKVCPKDLEMEFLKGYEPGYRQFELEQDLAEQRQLEQEREERNAEDHRQRMREQDESLRLDLEEQEAERSRRYLEEQESEQIRQLHEINSSSI